jgi:hypothetical protein
MTAPDNESARWEAAARVRRARPGWVVIWSVLRGEYQARPLFRARDVIASAATPEMLMAKMDAIAQAAKRTPNRAWR